MTRSHKRTILVTGATGKQGGAVWRHLREKGFGLRALARDPESAAARALVGHGEEVVRGDLNDPDSLRRALDGVNGAYSVQGYGIPFDEEVRQGTALVDAANREEVDHFVYSSVGSADQNTGIPHFESKGKIEEHLRNSGLIYTILRPVFFMENWEMMADSIAQGEIALPLSPRTQLQMIAVDDIGGFAALAFEHPGKWRDKAITIAGDELTMEQIAQNFSRITGREVRYRQVPWDQFENQVGHELTVMYRWFEDYGYNVNFSEVRQEYPRLTSFNRWLETTWSAAKVQRA